MKQLAFLFSYVMFVLLSHVCVLWPQGSKPFVLCCFLPQDSSLDPPQLLVRHIFSPGLTGLTCRCMFRQRTTCPGSQLKQEAPFLNGEVEDVVSSELVVELHNARDCSGWPNVSCAKRSSPTEPLEQAKAKGSEALCHERDLRKDLSTACPSPTYTVLPPLPLFTTLLPVCYPHIDTILIFDWMLKLPSQLSTTYTKCLFPHMVGWLT